jgi:thioredoxin reductase (NADPH)
MPADVEKIEDDGGKPRVHFKNGAAPAETFDAVIYGLGGMTPVEFLRTSGVRLDDKGEPAVNAQHETSVPRLYVVGDLLGKGKGGGSIIAGFNSATEAVRDLLARYCGKQLEPEIVSLDHLRF